MANKFITKRPHKKYIRPVRNSSVKHLVATEPEVMAEAEETQTKEEKTDNDMDNKQYERIESVLAATKKPGVKQRVRVEKKDKGLHERATMEETTLLTEDGRALLND